MGATHGNSGGGPGTPRLAGIQVVVRLEVSVRGSRLIRCKVHSERRKWFNLSVDFVARTDAEFSAIPSSSLKRPEYDGDGQGAYNAMVATAEPAGYALLDDKKKVMHGGGINWRSLFAY